MIHCYLGLGSNLQQPIQQVSQAIEEIAALPQSKLIKSSSLYESAPMGPQDQNNFINAVVLLGTDLSPENLLDYLQAIEQSHHRQRNGERWGPRTLDCDILLYGEQTISSERLVIPHYGLQQRYFVLKPLYEIAPNLLLPGGQSVEQALAHCKDKYDLNLIEELAV